MQEASPSGRLKLGNRILDGLSVEVLAELRPHLETVSLSSNQIIHEPQVGAEYAYFPTSGMISIVATMADGAEVETGLAGREGMIGVSSILGDGTPSQKAMVQLYGSAVRVKAPLLRQIALANPDVLGLLLRYAQCMLVTARQSAACNRLHLLEQRCARWLLMARDRAEGDTFPMTHEFLSMMLGVRRAGVTVALQAYRDSGVITYNHGTMTILDRAELETMSCECYRVIERETKRLIGGA